tara:strand:+ start:188 stop:946 length:759 start_codon:yes stop_codon:yes gene_type:complete
MKILGIIQARMGSSRLPGKVLKDINGEPMIKFLINRLKMSKHINDFVVATTTSKHDDELVEYLKTIDTISFRGSEDNVLNRFYKCASKYDADIIVRITADDPFKDYKVIDRAVSIFLESNEFDYVSNTIKLSFPEGIDVEVFSYRALSIANKFAVSKFEKEHVTPYIIDKKNDFNIKNFLHHEDLSSIRLTVDYPIDFLLAEKICSNFKNDSYFEFGDIVDFLEKNPKIANLNNNIKSREYLLNVTNKGNDD